MVLVFNSPVYATQVEFPQVVLKNVPTDIRVYTEDTLEVITLNNEIIPLIERDGFYKGTITLKDDKIQFKDSSTSYNYPLLIPGWLSVLPPLIAIALALIFKEVISSLFIGIFVGAAIIGVYADGASGFFTAFLSVLDTYILNALFNEEHLAVILFSMLIGSIVAVISKNGGMRGVVSHLAKFAKTRRSGSMTAYILGIAIFFDDYANTLVVGNTMRPITDKLKISREKLAYIVDSTAAPVAATAFITTWIGAELTYISDGVKEIEAAKGVKFVESAYSIFMNSLPYAFYSIFTLVFMFILIYRQRDYGSMYKAEVKAKEEGINEETISSSELQKLEPADSVKPKSYNAIIPIAIIVFGTLVGLLYTGMSSMHTEMLANGVDVSKGTWSAITMADGSYASFFTKLGLVIGNSNSFVALLWASLTGLGVAILLTVIPRIMTLKDTMETVVVGFNSMLSTMIILILAWSLAGTTEALSTAQYLQTFFDADFSHTWVIPALTFILSGFISFSTGSSWSTMALMYPLVIPLSYTVALNDPNYSEMMILHITIASVLAGSVLGDHCSPISDTTILSSMASSCNHIQHVKTQMPYAITVGLISLFIGIIPVALGVPVWITLTIGILMLYLIIQFVGKKI